MIWRQNGPVSLPPRSAVYVVAMLVATLALAGAGFGLRSGWRDGGRPTLDQTEQTSVADDATPAIPIVEIPSVQQQAAAAPTAAANAAEDNSADETADSNAMAAGTAAAQAAQTMSSASATQAGAGAASPANAAKPSGSENGSGAAPISDVPF
ncbi:MAG TPA: hypothetical protein VMU93_01170 [Caulobacteraceae bacterium]|nr:hypothetical protein [Caulobacteraceae bacterium]